MIDLKRISPIFNAKSGIAMTILVFTSACAHEIFVRPANNDSVSQELNQITPEPEMPAQVSAISDSKPAAAPVRHHAKYLAAAHKHKKKSFNVAHHKAIPHRVKHVTATQVASVKDVAPPAPPATPAPPAPEIAPPPIPAPLASAGVQTEITDEGGHLGTYLLYGLGGIAVLGLIYIAPRARRKSGPKRKLVFNG